MQAELITVGERAIQVLENWTKAYTSIQGVGVSTDLISAHTPGVTVAEVNRRVIAGLSAVATLRNIEVEKLELLAHRLPTVKSAIDAMDVQALAVEVALEPLHGAVATDRNGHLNLQVQHAEKGTQNYDLGSPLLAILQNCNTLLDNLPYVAQAVGEKSAPVFVGIAEAIGEQATQAKSAAVQAARELAAGSAVLTELKACSESTSKLLLQAQELVATATTQKASVDTNVAEVEQKLARAREISKDADTLQQRVTSFAAQFEAFEAQMAIRLKDFAEFEAATKEAQQINGERDVKIEELIDKADTMIRGATTAGLSKSLEDTKTLYEDRLETTQKYFLWSVVVLLVCSLPIAAQLVPGPWQQYFAPQAGGGGTDTGLWLSALGKLILVIPATWATAFFARNYAELFHLSREYAHKAALAKAIDGFKREAPEYKAEIVAGVFMEIQENPGSRKSPEPATPQNPIYEKAISKIMGAIKNKGPT